MRGVRFTGRDNSFSDESFRGPVPLDGENGHGPRKTRMPILIPNSVPGSLEDSKGNDMSSMLCTTATEEDSP